MSWRLASGHESVRSGDKARGRWYINAPYSGVLAVAIARTIGNAIRAAAIFTHWDLVSVETFDPAITRATFGSSPLARNNVWTLQVTMRKR